MSCRTIDLANAPPFGKWTVLRVDGRIGAQIAWLCRCECGTEKRIPGGELRRGRTTRCRSCGNRRDRFGTGWPEKKIWLEMIRRCHSPNANSWKHYGGRGIYVCERWRNSFADFIADVGRRPSAGMSIDRIDNDGHYEPGNVRWATKTEQARNMRTNRIIEFGGERLTITGWAEKLGERAGTLYRRLYFYGWPEERVVSEPIRRRQSSQVGE